MFYLHIFLICLWNLEPVSIHDGDIVTNSMVGKCEKFSIKNWVTDETNNFPLRTVKEDVAPQISEQIESVYKF